MIQTKPFITRYFGTAAFRRRALLLTLPILVQNLLTTSFSLIDTLMVSSLGTVELTAAGLAASWVSLMNVVLFGTCSAAGVLVAQYWGGAAKQEATRSHGCGMCLCLGFTVLYLMLTAGCPTLVMRLYTTDEAVISAGCAYLRLVAMGFPAVGLQQIANASLRSTGSVRTPMYGTVVCVLTNILLNYILIFGNLGAPALGLPGAALASSIANWIGTGVTYCLAIHGRTIVRAHPLALLGFDRDFLHRYLTVAWPIMLNEVLWGCGTAVQNMIFGHMGTVEYAALTICTTLESVITMMFLSLAASSAVLVGQEIGSGNREQAYENALVLSCWAPVLAGVFGGILFLIRNPVIGLFQQSGEVVAVALGLVGVAAFLQPFRIFQYIHICGILRAGADGKRAALYDFIGIWCISVPLAFLGLMMGLPILPVYFCVHFCDAFVKDILVLRRFRSKKWMIEIEKAGTAPL